MRSTNNKPTTTTTTAFSRFHSILSLVFLVSHRIGSVDAFEVLSAPAAASSPAANHHHYQDHHERFNIGMPPPRKPSNGQQGYTTTVSNSNSQQQQQYQQNQPQQYQPQQYQTQHQQNHPQQPNPHFNPRYPNYPFDQYAANPFFHRINLDYPGLQLIHEEPYIFIVNDFLTQDECDRLITKVGGNPHRMKIGDNADNNPNNNNPSSSSVLRAQLGGGAVIRTSSGAVCVNEEVPTIRRKMAQLCHINDGRQLQPLKISRYLQGQTFSKHTDAWPTAGAPIATQGWCHADDFFGDAIRPEQGCWSSRHQPGGHNNFMTCLVYLNDVPQGRGGCTTFPNLGLHQGHNGGNFYHHPTPMASTCRVGSNGQRVDWDWNYGDTLRIQPQKGMALLHFCSTTPEWGGICDGNTFHIAEPPAPGFEKYVTQQFMASCTEWELPDDCLPLAGRVSGDTI